MPDFTWEKALVLSSRRLGERSFITAIFTREQGRALGVVNKKQPPNTGTFVAGRWQARLAEQLGHFYLEETHSFAARYLDDRQRLACLFCVCALLDDLLPEHQAFPDLYDTVFTFLNQLDTDDFLMRYIRFEQALLSEVGFGLDTSGCAGGGDPTDLAYISPKTGRAVSRSVGAPYRTKLLPLPRFMWQDSPATATDIQNGLNLTGYFLQTFALKHALPRTRTQLYPLK